MEELRVGFLQCLNDVTKDASPVLSSASGVGSILTKVLHISFQGGYEQFQGFSPFLTVNDSVYIPEDNKFQNGVSFKMEG